MPMNGATLELGNTVIGFDPACPGPNRDLSAITVWRKDRRGYLRLLSLTHTRDAQFVVFRIGFWRLSLVSISLCLFHVGCDTDSRLTISFRVDLLRWETSGSSVRDAIRSEATRR
jgi:hypothetical protein